jgi:hypothetical protein
VNGTLVKGNLDDGSAGAFLLLENGHKFHVTSSRNAGKYNPLDSIGSRVVVSFRATSLEHGDQTISVIRDVRVAKIDKLEPGQNGPKMIENLYVPGMDLPPIPQSRIVDAYLPSGSTELTLEDASGFSVGDHIHVTKTTNERWRDDLGMGERLRHIQMHRPAGRSV